MATEIAQKSHKALFPLWSLKKKDKLKLIKQKKLCREKDWKHWKESWYWNQEKGGIILILFCMNSKKVANVVFRSI